MSSASWDTVRTKVRAFHTAQSAYSYPYQRDFVFDHKYNRTYFLGSERRAVPTKRSSKASPSASVSVVPPPGDYGRFGIGVESPRYLHKSEGQREGQTNGNTSKGVGKCMSLFAAELPKVDTRRTRRRRCRCGGVRIGENAAPLSKQTTSTTNSSNSSRPSEPPSTDWIPLVAQNWLKARSPTPTSSPSKEEQLLKERKRISIQGILAFQFIPPSDTTDGSILFPYNNSIYIGHLGPDISDFSPTEIPNAIPGSSRLDPRIGGYNNSLVAFIRDNDIWVSTLEGHEQRLTRSERPEVANGIAEYIMQEEFRRFTGYWWCPLDRRKSTQQEQILYIRTDCTDVEVVYLPRQDLEGEMDEYRYPRPGKPNVVGEPYIVEFDSQLGSGQAVERRLWDEFNLREAFPWMEYIARAGWTPDGRSVHLQVLDRSQSRTALLLIPSTLFMSESQYIGYMDGTRSLHSWERIYVLVDETSPIWINVTDTTVFYRPVDEVDVEDDNYAYDDTPTPQPMDFIWASERSGWRHLYRGVADVLMAENRVESERVVYARTQLQQLTHGDWSVVDHPVFVDVQNRLVYFMAKVDRVLETHAYVVSLDGDDISCECQNVDPYCRLEDSGVGIPDKSHRPVSRPKRLTSAGGTHYMKMDQECRFFVDVWSSFGEAPQSIVGSVEVDEDELHLRELVYVRPTDAEVGYGGESCYGGHVDTGIPVPQAFSFINSEGIEIHGLIYTPTSPASSPSQTQRYPTILRVYGGPNVQTCSNEYKHPKFTRIHLALSLGYCVVLVDGRGSSDRGLAFEGAIKFQLGTVEVRDQVEALIYLALRDNGEDGKVGDIRDFGVNLENLNGAWEKVKVGVGTGRWGAGCIIDLEKIAVTGWSYGGYLSLLLLAHHPRIFKMCLAGAPVTCWELYDSAYTERYLGLPSSSDAGYTQGRVLEWVEQFPDQENRLLLVHGLQDENVHFKHTELLVSSLVKNNKPHQLQIYPGERHGLRNPNVVEHFETLMFWWFGRYL